METPVEEPAPMAVISFDLANDPVVDPEAAEPLAEIDIVKDKFKPQFQ